MAKRIKIFDTTLRDGEQSPGCTMNLSEKIEVARQLERLKVDVIEAGFAISSPGDFESVKTIAESVSDCTVASLARCKAGDIDAAWNAVKGAADPRIHVFLATSPIHMEYKLRMKPEEVIARTSEMVSYAKKYCSNIEFSCEDATRSDWEFMKRVVDAAIKAGATVINLPDTVGYTTPAEMKALIQYMMENVPDSDKIEYSVHCHNDLGMAVANALAGVQGGALQIECTVNGIGERAGSCPLEPLVMSLQCLYGIDTGIKYENLLGLSQEVSKRTGKAVPATKAIVGTRLFGWETGLPTGYWQKSKDINPLIMMPYHFNMTGQPAPHIYIGKKSGGANVALVNERLGLAPIEDKDVVKELLAKVKALSISVKRDLTDEEYTKLYNETVGC